MEWHVWCTFQKKPTHFSFMRSLVFFPKVWPWLWHHSTHSTGVMGRNFCSFVPQGHVDLCTSLDLHSIHPIDEPFEGSASDSRFLFNFFFWRLFWKAFFCHNLFVRQLGLWFNSLFTSVLLKSSELRNTQLQDFTIKFSKLSMLGCLAAWLLPRWAHQKLKNLQDQGVVLTPECIFVAAVAWGEHGHIQIPFGLITRYFTKRANMSQINRALQYIEQNEEARWVKAGHVFLYFCSIWCS